MSIVLQFFPNGEFSQGVDTSKKRRDKQRRHESIKIATIPKERRHEYLQWQREFQSQFGSFDALQPGTTYIGKTGYEYILRDFSSDSCTLSWHDSTGKIYHTSLSQCFSQVAFMWGLAPLVHQSVESCENPGSLDAPLSRKKLEAMTKNMARNIRNGVYLLEQQPGGKDCLSFLTLTLPNLSADGLGKCCLNWDYMVKRFLDWLRTKVEEAGFNFIYVYATEIQTKRLQKRHEYAPHLHLVFRGRNGKKSSWVISPKQARKAWKRCIDSVVTEPFRDDALENLQRIRFSAARYLSKYLSKGHCEIPEGAKNDAIQALKTQWGGMARSVCRAIKRNTVRLDSQPGRTDVVLSFLTALAELLRLGLIRYYKKGFITLGKDITTGLEYGLHVCRGALSTPTFECGLDSVLSYISNRLRNGFI